ncbi:DUF3558 domain-containing protein [Gordonia sp. 135]|uniref:DUF3558 family protein n=1 Tax=Gordonia TaxID=2053 RepID=UPI0012BB25A8|nr:MULTISPECIES: DUF3558 family protein [Gordonia]MDH3052363.1 DUF3558 family protein [Gordonia alkanivorans]QGP90376.1 DUF3558 domain-containing protein [Gordonia sp. 135]
MIHACKPLTDSKTLTQLGRRTLAPRRIVHAVASLSAVVIASLGVSSCATSGTPLPALSSLSTASSESSVRQVDGAGNRLPFETAFPNRWSSNNDGTTFEPCTQVPKAAIEDLGLDENSVDDAAASDFQTARGCQWTFISDGRSRLSQFVGNINGTDTTLSGYKTLNSKTKTWFPDTLVAGRRVLVGSGMPAECAAIVQSGSAIVTTLVIRLGSPRPPTPTICETAISFLRATITEIPL